MSKNIKKWPDIRDERGRVAALTPLFRKKFGKFYVYLTEFLPFTETQKEILSEVGFQVTTRKSQSGYPVWVTGNFAGQNKALDMGPNNKVTPDGPSRFSMVVSAFPQTEIISMDYASEMQNLEYGAPDKQELSHERDLEPNQDTIKTSQVAIDDTTYLGLNHLGQKVFESDKSRYIQPTENAELVLATIDTPSADYLRVRSFSIASMSNALKGMVNEAMENPDFNEGDVDRYVDAICRNAFNVATRQAAKQMALQILRSSVTTHIKAVDLTNDELVNSLDNFAIRLPSGEEATEMMPSVAAAARHVFAHIEDLGGVAVSPHHSDGIAASTLSSMGFRNVISQTPKPHVEMPGITVSGYDISINRLDQDMQIGAMLGTVPSGDLEKPITRNGFNYEYIEHLATVNALSGLAEDGTAVLQIPSIARAYDKTYLDHLSTMFNVHSISYLENDFGRGDESSLLLVVNGRLPTQEADRTYQGGISTALSRAEAISFLARVGEEIQVERRENIEQDIMASGLDDAGNKVSLSRLTLSEIANSQAAKDKLNTATKGELVNSSQVLHRPISGLGSQMQTYIPQSLVRQTQLAQANIRKKLRDLGFLDEKGNPDMAGFVADRLQLEREFILDEDVLGRHQVDSVGQSIILKETEGLSSIVGAGTGTGKTRIMAALARYSLLNEHPVYLMGNNSVIFQKFMDEMEILKADKLVQPQLLIHATNLFDASGKVVAHSNNNIIKDQMSKQSYMPGNVFFATNNITNRPLKRKAGESYSDFDVRKSQTKAAWVERTFDHYKSIGQPITLLMDESHTSAGISNSFEAAQTLIRKSGWDIHLSGTSLPRPHAFRLYQNAFPEKVQFEPMMQYLHKGGIPAAESIASSLIQLGSMQRIELADNKRVNIIKPANDEQKNFNRDVSDRFAVLFDMYTTATGEITAAVSTIVDEENKRLAAIANQNNQTPPDPKSPRELGFEHEHFGSVASRVSEMVNCTINMIQTVDEVVKANANGERVVVSLQRTGSSLLDRVIDNNDLKAGEEFTPPTLKDLARSLVDDCIYVTVRTGKNVHKQDIRDSMQPAQAQELTRLINKMNEYIENEIPELCALPIDYLRESLMAQGITVGEISGRTYRVKLDPANPAAKAVAVNEPKNTQKVLNGYHNGLFDVVVINDAGASGIDLHAMPGTSDSRPVRLLIGELSNNPVNAVQTLGRVDRAGQISKPQLAMVSNGVPGEVCRTEQIISRIAYVSGTSTGDASQINISSTHEGDSNLLSDAGQRAIIQYLIGNPQLARRIQMLEEVEPFIDDVTATKEYSTTTKINISSRFMARLRLLKCAEAEGIIADVSSEADRISKEDLAMGRNAAGGIRRIPGQGLVTKKDVIYRSAEIDKAEDPFVGDVYVYNVEYERVIEPMSASNVEKIIEAGAERLNSPTALGSTGLNGVKQDLSSRYFDIMLETLDQNDIRDIKAHTGDTESRNNLILEKIGEALDVNNRKVNGPSTRYNHGSLSWLIENIEMIEPGRVINHRPENSLFPNRGVITDVTPPREEQRHSLGLWRISYICPGDEEIRTTSLQGLYASSAGEVPVLELNTFADDDDFADEFDMEASKGRHNVKEAYEVLHGNMAQAALMLGDKSESVLFEDNMHVLRNGMLVPRNSSILNIQRNPVAMPSIETAIAYLKDGINKHTIRTSVEFQANEHAAISSDEYGNFTLTVPGNKKHGDIYHNDTVMRTAADGSEIVINPFEAETSRRWDKKGRARTLTFSADKLPNVLDLLERRLDVSKNEALYADSGSLKWLNQYNSDLAEGRDRKQSAEYEETNYALAR